MILMEYVRATMDDLKRIKQVVQDTIKAVYPRYYPKEVVDFFCNLHNEENIQKDIANGTVGILIVDGVIVGTGCYQDNHITRVYVLPQYQGNGYGTYIMQCLEERISQKEECVYLDASLPASCLYEKRGYTTVKHCKWLVENNAVLVYEVMKKKIVKAEMDKNGNAFGEEDVECR